MNSRCACTLDSGTRHREREREHLSMGRCSMPGLAFLADRVGGGVTPAVLPHHRTYGSVYGGSCLLTNSVSELGSVDVSPVVTKRPDRPSEFPTPTS